MMSIAKTALHKTNIKVIFIYGNKNKEETLFFDEIEGLRVAFPERFFVHYAFSQQPWGGHFTGRINDAIINKVFDLYKDLNWGRYYACGPSEMVKNVRDSILMRGISEDRIFTELFEAPPTETDFSALEGNADITLIEGDKEHTFGRKESNIIELHTDAGLRCTLLVPQ